MSETLYCGREQCRMYQVIGQSCPCFKDENIEELKRKLDEIVLSLNSGAGPANELVTYSQGMGIPTLTQRESG